jgi:hypothetical protein
VTDLDIQTSKLSVEMPPILKKIASKIAKKNQTASLKVISI